MKKLIALASLLLILGTSTTLLAQNNKEQRKELRAQQQAAFTTKLTAAITNQNFTFIAQQYQSPFGSMMPINSLQNYITFDPDYVGVNLPYISSSPVIQIPKALDFSAFRYKYDAVVNNDMAYIKIFIDNVQNLQDFDVPQNVSYTIHMQIYLSTGNTVVTMAPSFNNQIQYFGTIQFN